jgi:hypothetical protein
MALEIKRIKHALDRENALTPSRNPLSGAGRGARLSFLNAHRLWLQ